MGSNVAVVKLPPSHFFIGIGVLVFIFSVFLIPFVPERFNLNVMGILSMIIPLSGFMLVFIGIIMEIRKK